MTQSLLELNVFARGIHHNSIFKYDIPSHRIMNDLISIFHKIAYFVIEKSSRYKNYFIECFDSEECEIEKERFRDLTDIIINSFVEVLKRFEKRVKEWGLITKIEDYCEEDECYIDIYLIQKVDSIYINQVLITELQANIVDVDEGVNLDITHRTSINVFEKPIPIFYIENILGYLEIPNNPDSEIQYKIFL